MSEHALCYDAVRSSTYRRDLPTTCLTAGRCYPAGAVIRERFIVTVHRGKRVQAALLSVALLGSILVSIQAAKAVAVSAAESEQAWQLLDQPFTDATPASHPILGAAFPDADLFSPAPVASIAVVAKIDRPVSSSSWQVSFVNDLGAVLAAVSFSSETDAYQLKTGSFAWPGANRTVRITTSWISSELCIAGVCPVPDSTLTVRSAIVRVHQSGVLKKSASRVALSAGNETAADATFADLANVVHYYHVAGDFAPAPTVRLEAVASAGEPMPVGVPPKIEVRLIDSNGVVVSGAGLAFTSPQVTSAISPPLTLTDGRLYRLQVRSDSAGATLYLARLIMDQSSATGIARTVAWLPSVSFATSFTSDAESLSGPALAPAFDQAGPVRAAWIRSVATEQGSGSHADVVLQNAGAGSMAPQFSAHTGYMYRLTEIAVPVAGNLLNSVGRLYNQSLLNPIRGMVSSSALRVAADLLDAAAPAGTFTQTTNPYYPGVFSPSGWPASFQATITDRSPPIAWTLDIVNAGGVTVRSWAGSVAASPATITQTWDGHGSDGRVQLGGAYQAQLRTRDAAGNSNLRTQSVRLELTPLVIASASVTPAFNPTPNIFASARFTASFSRLASYTLQIADAQGQIVRTISTGTNLATQMDQFWNGKNDAGALLAAGAYTATLTATDYLGNRSVTSLQTIIDATPPTIDALQSPPASPLQGTVHLEVSAQDSGAGLINVQFLYRQVNGDETVGPWLPIATISGATPFAYDWPTFSTADGTIDLVARAADKAGNVSWNAPLRIEISNQGPTISGFTSSPSAFSPSGNSPDPTTTLSAALADASTPIDWSIAITNTSGATVQTFAGSGDSISQPWTGLDGAGQSLAEGIYTATLTATNASSQSTIATTSIVIDNTSPDLLITSPINGSETSFTKHTVAGLAQDVFGSSALPGSGIDPASISLTVANTGSSDPSQTPAVTFTGETIQSGFVALEPGATYTATLEAADLAGNHTQTTSTFTAVLDAPSTSHPAFSPNQDGVKDTITITDTLDAPASTTWTLAISNGQQTVRSFPSGAGVTISQSWDGTDNDGNVVPDGAYQATLQATSPLGDLVVSNINLIVDTVSPTIVNVAPGHKSNTLWKRPPITTTITDDGAGIDIATLTHTLDGATLLGAYEIGTGSFTATPAVDLSIDDYHYLDFEAADLAGNRAIVGSRFRVVNIEQTPVTAAIPPVSATVPSTCVGGCSVTFTGTSVALQSHTVTISSSAHAGSGTITHPIPLEDVVVQWETTSGPRMQPLPLDTVESQQPISVASATDAPLTRVIPASQIDLGPITVAAPADVIPDSEATIAMSSTSVPPNCTNTQHVLSPDQCGIPLLRGLLEPLTSPLFGTGKWTGLTIPDELQPRWGTATAWDDSARQEIVVFGGCTHPEALTRNACLTDQVTNETWTYKPSPDDSPGTWTRHTPQPNWPTPRYGAALAFDPHLGEDGRVVMVGGLDGSATTTTNGEFESGTWQWDGTNWTTLNVVSDQPPSTRIWPGFATDNLRFPVLFGGCVALATQNLCDQGVGYSRETWRLDTTRVKQGFPAEWKNMCGACGGRPSGRISTMMTYYPAVDQVILFGGEGVVGNGIDKLNDMYAWDGKAGKWTRVDERSPALVPSKRSGAGFASLKDPQTDILLMYGGGEDRSKLFNETWRYEATNDPILGIVGTWAECSSCDEPSGESIGGYDAGPKRALTGFATIGDYSGRAFLYGGIKQYAPEHPERYGNSFRRAYVFDRSPG